MSVWVSEWVRECGVITMCHYSESHWLTLTLTLTLTTSETLLGILTHSNIEISQWVSERVSVYVCVHVRGREREWVRSEAQLDFTSLLLHCVLQIFGQSATNGGKTNLKLKILHFWTNLQCAVVYLVSIRVKWTNLQCAAVSLVLSLWVNKPAEGCSLSHLYKSEPTCSGLYFTFLTL